MDLPDPSLETSSVQEVPTVAEASLLSLPSAPNTSIQEYFQLQKELFTTVIVIIAIAFPSVWAAYSLNIALNYLLGACTGVVYLKLLARSVEQLGREKTKVGRNQLALFIGLIVVASQVDQLQILPIFLGFLTYKAAVIFYMLKSITLT